MSRDELKAGTKVLVEAVVTMLRPTREGYVDVEIYDYYFYEEDGSGPYDAENLRLPQHHIHPFPGVQEWRLPESIEDTVQFKAENRGHESWVDADGFPIAKCISNGIAELVASLLNSIIPPPSSAEQGEGGGK